MKKLSFEEMIYELKLLDCHIRYMVSKDKSDVTVILPAEVDELYQPDEIEALEQYVKDCVLKKMT